MKDRDSFRSCLPDPTTDDRVHVSGGRGAMLIGHFMDDVMYAGHGNRIIMQKDRSGPDQDQPD